MPHGLDSERARFLLKERPEVWVSRMKEREGVSAKPMRMIDISGINAICVDPRGGKARFRIPLAKLETISASWQSKSVALVRKVVDSIAVMAQPAEPGPSPAPTLPQPPNPREIAMSSVNAPRVIFDQAAQRFFTQAKKWVPDLAEARRYDSSRGINVAIGILGGARGRAKGRDLVAITLQQAKSELERVARPKPAESETVATAAPAADHSVPPHGMVQAQPAAPEARRQPSVDVMSAFDRLALAMRNCRRRGDGAQRARRERHR